MEGKRARISQAQLAREPYLGWNAFIELIACTPPHDLAPAQRPAQLAFLYSAEVLNGGHLQFFTNRGVAEVPATLAALQHIGAHKHVPVLEAALRSFHLHPPGALSTSSEYVAAALEDQFGQADTAFHAIAPSIEALLELHLQAHLTLYLEVVGGV